MSGAARPKLGVFKLASCDGCQLQILNLEDELLALSERVEIAHFLEASSRSVGGPYDVALVEGSVSTARDVERIRAIRAASRTLVAIGACATSGGIQHLRNLADVEAWKAELYPHPEWVETLATSTPLSDHVAVDHEIHGCPVSKAQLLRVLLRSLLGAAPDLPGASVCLECKRRGYVCVVVAKGLPCLGPATRAGCGALCPSLGRDCYGCFGPAEGAQPAVLAEALRRAGHSQGDVARRFRGIQGHRREWRELADRLEGRGE